MLLGMSLAAVGLPTTGLSALLLLTWQLHLAELCVREECPMWWECLELHIAIGCYNLCAFCACLHMRRRCFRCLTSLYRGSENGVASVMPPDC